jgi:hypothetical protein
MIIMFMCSKCQGQLFRIFELLFFLTIQLSSSVIYLSFIYLFTYIFLIFIVIISIEFYTNLITKSHSVHYLLELFESGTFAKRFFIIFTEIIFKIIAKTNFVI